MRRGALEAGRALCLLAVAAVAGCASQGVPEDALRLPESTLEIRSIQTRTFEAPSESDILTASVAVIQDMEFNIDRIEKRLGVITASKSSDAGSAVENAGWMTLDILCGIGTRNVGCGAHEFAADDQNVTLTLVVLPSLSRPGLYSARVTLQRVVYDKGDRVKLRETIDDPLIYQTIFNNLQKSLYIQVSEG